MNNTEKVFLQLVRLGIGHGEGLPLAAYGLSTTVDWEAVKALADKQGLAALVLDGLERLQVQGFKVQYSMPKLVRLQWIGEVLQKYEARYKAYKEAIGALAGWYNAHGFKMMVLKGFTCSLDWPIPEHRPTGDIDIWLFGQQKKADAALCNDNDYRIEIDNSHHHHTVSNWEGFIVENHYDFINVHAHRSSRELEKLLKVLGNSSNQNDNENMKPEPMNRASAGGKLACTMPCKEEDEESQTFNLKPTPTARGLRHGCVEVNGETVYLPSPNLNSLFMIRHMVAHFAGADITLRQVLDWAFFVEKHAKGVDWKWLEEQLEKFQMMDFYNCINAICVDDLGFSAELFPNVQFLPSQKERVLNDILSPEFQGEEPQKLFARMVFKYHRWQANAWKHRLCYPESRWSTFWSGVWNHLLKPSSI